MSSIEYLSVLEQEKQIAANHNSIAKEQHARVDYKGIVCEKPWGHEFLIYQNKKVAIWFLRIVKGQSTSLHCHFKKDTLLTTLAGCGKITLFHDEVIDLPVMKSIFLPRNKFHALSVFSDDAYFLEMEIFGEDLDFSDKNDLLRIHDVYQRDIVGYESSVHCVTQRESSIPSFYLDFANTEYSIQGCRFAIKNTLDAVRDPRMRYLLLQGNVYYRGTILKEGSILTPDICYELVSHPDSLCILEIDRPYAEEDRKIIYDLEHLQVVQKRLERNQQRIILTSGCFDIVHVGHLHHLKCAKNMGDTLMVCLSNDEQIAKLKGPTRPVNKYKDRIDLFKTISYIDYVILYDETNIEREETLGTIMKIVRPYAWTKGNDYTPEQILQKHPYLERIMIISNIENTSTTRIIQRINDSGKNF